MVHRTAPLLGAHVSAAGGVDKAIERAQELGAESMQLFTQSPLQWRGRPIGMNEAENFRRSLLAGSVKTAISHAPYLINLAASDEYTRKQSVNALIAEVERCGMLGVDATVVHPGSSRGTARDEAIARTAESVREVLKRTDMTNVRILLETMAGQGDTLGSSVRELADMIELNDWHDRLGICVDMCHVFGAGADIRTANGYEHLISVIHKQVGLKRVGCWHLSDNKGELSSKLDRHAHIGEGMIGHVPFGMLAADERFAGVPAVLETPKDGLGDAGNLALLKKLRGYE